MDRDINDPEMLKLRDAVSAALTRTIVEMVRASAVAFGSVDGVAFVLRDGDQCYYADDDAIGPLFKGKRYPMTSCISGWCMLNGKTAAVEDVYADPRLPHDVYRETFVKSLLMTPVGGTSPIAAIGLYWANQRTFSAQSIAAVEALAGAVGNAMKAADLT